MALSRWMGCEEAGKLLGVDAATIRGWAKKRIEGGSSRLRFARRPGKAYLVSRKEILKILRTNWAPSDSA